MENPNSNYKDENIYFNEFLTRFEAAFRKGEINAAKFEKKIEEFKKTGNEAGRKLLAMG
jgi:hypothetical protein